MGIVMNKNLYELFIASNRPTSKHINYFTVYEKLFQTYKNKPITFVEIGVLDGGSLNMWQNFFGESARIIGIDFNPNAKALEADGFEIHIGDQQDPKFWREFFKQVGEVDVLLDDGGHTYLQQQVTLMEGLDHIRDGGMLVVEDTHTSFMRGFGFPSHNTFINFARQSVDFLYARFPNLDIAQNKVTRLVYSIEFFESIVSFKIDRGLSKPNHAVLNFSKLDGVEPNRDYRYESFPKLYKILQKNYSWFALMRTRHKLGFLVIPVRNTLGILFSAYTHYLNRQFRINKKQFFLSN